MLEQNVSSPGLNAEAVQDVVGSMVAGAGGTYDDAAGTITLPSGGAVSSVVGRIGDVTLTVADLTDAASLATDAELTAGLAGKANAAHGHDISDVSGLQSALDGKQPAGSYAASTHTHTSANTTDFAEAVQDVVGSMVTGAGGTYDDAAGTITLPSGGGGGVVGFADLPAGTTLTVVYASGWPARPTARTDIHVHWVGGPDVRPAGALTGDIHTPDQEV